MVGVHTHPDLHHRHRFACSPSYRTLCVTSANIVVDPIWGMRSVLAGAAPLHRDCPVASQLPSWEVRPRCPLVKGCAWEVRCCVFGFGIAEQSSSSSGVSYHTGLRSSSAVSPRT